MEILDIFLMVQHTMLKEELNQQEETSQHMVVILGLTAMAVLDRVDMVIEQEEAVVEDFMEEEVGDYASGAGGSGYLGTGVTNGSMYIYSSTLTSTSATTKTVSTNNVSSTATANYTKSGSGYARITLVE